MRKLSSLPANVKAVLLLGALVVIGVTLWSAAAVGALPRGGAAGATQPVARVVHMDERLAHEFKSLAELKASSSSIVVGTVTAQSSQTIQHTVFTRSTLRIDQVLWSKEAAAASVVVWQFGGRAADGTTYVMDDYPVFAAGRSYVLFLTPAQSAGEYWTTGSFQGAFSLDNNRNVSSYSPASTHVGVYVPRTPIAVFAQSVAVG